SGRLQSGSFQSLLLFRKKEVNTMTNFEHTDQWSILNQLPTNQPTPPLPVAIRDGQGRFLTGNSGGGRPKGSRNKLTEHFLDAIVNDFAEHGAEDIARVRTDDPATYLKIIGSLMPRDLVLQRERMPIDVSEISDEELVEYINKRKREKFVEGVV